ncbi:MAG: hypothetical protein A2W33_09225, partial [Chloroflexi bacterium RBG_16_52_11]
MPDKEQPPLRIVVTAHPKLPEANSDANDVIAYLSERGIQSEYGLLYDDELTRKVKSGAFNMMIALGGDGTMLRAGHLCGPADIPIFGINLGRFGFLMDVRQNEWLDVMPRLLKRDYWLERRMMLAVEHCRGEDIISRWDVLNEIVIGRGQMVRPVHLVTEVDGRYLTTYVADALIASTPTGSTAYALAAGGPILPPELRNILLVAVAPHLSIDRAIVLAEGSSVTIMVYSDHQAVFSA